jgi:alkanesulfonate monooxygenase SsuD/methylene tetrahydromethanopterin reductase-like flavin-dependent oxidoreductase (luciferase family)
MSDLMDHGQRYDRMEEFVDVCRKLWDSVEPDAMLWDRATGRVGDPGKVHDVHHHGTHFKVDGPLNTPPSPQGRPVLIQAGGSPRGIRASAYFVDHAFGGDMPLALQVRQRKAFDEALVAHGRDPSQVGILWQTPIVVAPTEREAVGRLDQLIAAYPDEAVGAYLSYNCGYDFSKLPQSFSLRELHAEIIASQASPMGFLHELSLRLGPDSTLTRAEFFEHGRRDAVNVDTTLAGTPAQIADRLEEAFEATGSRGGFMLGHAASMPLDLIGIADLLVPELQRRGRFRNEYRFRTLRENLMDS